MKKFITSIVSLLFLQCAMAQDWSIKFSPTDVNCVTNTACFDIMIKSTGEAFKIGSSNLRIFFDAEFQSYVNNTNPISVQNGYTVTDREITAVSENLIGKGQISFDSNLGLLDIPIDFFGSEAEAIIIDTDTYTSIASNICFESTNKSRIGSNEDFVWVNQNTKGNYTSATTTIDRFSGETTEINQSVFSVEESLEIRNECLRSTFESSIANHPNPFSDQTIISYNVRYETDVELSIYSINGAMVYKEETRKPAGLHDFTVSNKDLDGAGVYLYIVKMDNTILQNRMILTN